jgi:hypothetical protein
MKQTSPPGKLSGLALGTALLALSVTLPAFAALGGDAASVDADVVKMKVQSRTATPVSGYTVNEMTLPTGTVVREYVSAEGKVFAVTWRGPSVPDLQQTLGAYFTTLTAAASVPHGADHHHLTVTTTDLVLQTGGHMGAHFGKAYVQSLLPPNFSLDEIK